MLPGFPSKPRGIMTSEYRQPDANSDPIFDEADLLRRVGQDRELARLLVSTFLGDMVCRRVELEALVRTRKAEGLRRLAHTIRGGAANVSALAIVEAARALEGMAQDPDWMGVHEGAGVLRQAMDRFQAETTARGWGDRPEEAHHENPGG